MIKKPCEHCSPTPVEKIIAGGSSIHKVRDLFICHVCYKIIYLPTAQVIDYNYNL